MAHCVHDPFQTRNIAGRVCGTRLCRPYRAQTKGKVEVGAKYVRRNFLCGLLGREPSGLIDLNGQLRWWLAEVANRRIHGTTHEQVMARWEADETRSAHRFPEWR